MIRLNLGAGHKCLDDWDNFDKNPLDERIGPLDLEEDTLPYGDSAVDFIQMIHVLEHIRDIRHIMNECHRVLSSKGELLIEVPRFPHEDAVKDPTHVRYFVPETFKYFEYDTTTDMYGYKKWVIVSLKQDDNSIIRVVMRPAK